MPETDALTRDHVTLEDTRVTRRYFAKFQAITGHLARVAAQFEAEGALSREDVQVLARYIIGLGFTFRALANKYHMTGRAEGPGPGKLTFDREESGFPVHAELMQMASDAAQAEKHLKALPSAEQLKRQMVEEIVGKLQVPTRLQYAMSQRLYYEEMLRGELFWAQNDPDAVWLGNLAEGRDPRRRYLVHWAVYDSQVNIPTIYLMELEDTGRFALPKDERRWPEVQSHLIAQAVAGLKLLTIAGGFDKDFDDLHPKRLRRFHLGPMYSSAFTLQTGPLKAVLEEAKAPEGEDWALAWTMEELVSERVETERSGWFGTVEREIFALDPFAGAADAGRTSMQRAIILPQRPFQVLAEKNPPGFREVRKFVVSPGGRVLSYR
ncbi:MAG: hypothetical protein KDK10_16660 [Maritimibacter sp.]|nr:hypothetical protein [Maritimibacter sp.]